MNIMRIETNPDRYDVVVCGGGCAGVLAATSAARQGARTLLLEKNGFSGGYITAVMGASLDGLVDLRSGLPIVGGLVEELAEKTCKGGFSRNRRYSPSIEMREIKETPDWNKIGFNFEAYKLEADRLMRGAGVEVLYHTFLASAEARDGRVDAVVVANKAGLTRIHARHFVDATGDADLACFAEAGIRIAPDPQPMSLHFRVTGIKITAEMRQKCGEVLKAAHARGELAAFGGPWLEVLGPDAVNINAVRLPGLGVDPRTLARAEVQGREDIDTMFRLWVSEVPEWRDAVLITTGPCVGARETRRLDGVASLSLTDVVECRPQEDVIAKGAWWIDRHTAQSSGYHMHSIVRPYDISLRTLMPKGIDNLLVAGRCHSAESEALASSRVTVTAMALGEAAGTAAGIAAVKNVGIRDVRVQDIQMTLLDSGAVILDRAEEILAVGDARADDVQSAVR